MSGRPQYGRIGLGRPALSQEQYRIRYAPVLRDLDAGVSLADLARKYQVSRQRIQAIVRRSGVERVWAVREPRKKGGANVVA